MAASAAQVAVLTADPTFTFFLSVKDNGVAAIESLMKKRGKFDYILLETTGGPLYLLLLLLLFLLLLLLHLLFLLL